SPTILSPHLSPQNSSHINPLLKVPLDFSPEYLDLLQSTGLLNLRTVLNPDLGYLPLKQTKIRPLPGFPLFLGEMRTVSLLVMRTMSPGPQTHVLTCSERKPEGQELR
ncbi:MAG TPA: hypothetical protein VN429_04790, partial [Methanospirillum sp.]|uniref:hypothetical protein n=1 Tax=Methanospirillum sp. TaxID=45200 RepID=UPI002CA70E7C